MVVVTGANGLLGSFVVRKLLEAGEPFIALKRENSDTALLEDVSGQIRWNNLDIRDAEATHDALVDAKKVIHCAALVSFHPGHKKKLHEVNVVGTRNVVNSCLANGVSRLVHVSSIGAIGRQKNVTEANESEKWAASPLNTAYGESKYLAELEVMRGREEGLEAVIVNPSVILGPGVPGRSSARIFYYVWKERRFYLDGQINYISAKDAAEIIYQLLRAGRSGERFIASAGMVTLQSLMEKIALHFGKNPPSIRLNTRLLTMLAWAERIRSHLFGVQPLITQESLRSLVAPVHFQNGKVRKALNFEFQSIDETLEWCCETYARQLNGKK